MVTCSGLFVISQARPEDSGRYSCSVTDGFVTSISTAQITVAGGGEQPSFGSRPTVTISPRYLTVRTNEPVEFQCSAKGVPQPIVTWTSNRGPLPSHVSIMGEYLRISAARKSDDALEFACTARNNLGTDSGRTILYVQGEESPAPTLPPFGLIATITPTIYEARPGETVRYR